MSQVGGVTELIGQYILDPSSQTYLGKVSCGLALGSPASEPLVPLVHKEYHRLSIFLCCGLWEQGEGPRDCTRGACGR